MKPRLKELGCKAGGVTTGLLRAGFEVTGVDIKPQPRYPYDDFVQEDALTTDLSGYDAFWASPSCQGYTRAAQQWRNAGKVYPDWLVEIRERLRVTGKPYIIENVTGAPLINPIKLNASMFGLKIRRTRLFECSFDVPFFLLPKDPHSKVRMGRKPRADEAITPVGHFSGVQQVQEITGFYWMNQAELAEAIPWQYSEFLGKYLMAEVTAARSKGGIVHGVVK